MLTLHIGDKITSQKTGLSSKIAWFVDMTHPSIPTKEVGFITTGSVFTDGDFVLYQTAIIGSVVGRRVGYCCDVALVRLSYSCMNLDTCENVLVDGTRLGLPISCEFENETTLTWVRDGIKIPCSIIETNAFGRSATGRFYRDKIICKPRYEYNVLENWSRGCTGELILYNDHPVGMLWGRSSPRILVTPLLYCFDILECEWTVQSRKSQEDLTIQRITDTVSSFDIACEKLIEFGSWTIPQFPEI